MPDNQWSILGRSQESSLWDSPASPQNICGPYRPSAQEWRRKSGQQTDEEKKQHNTLGCLRKMIAIG